MRFFVYIFFLSSLLLTGCVSKFTHQRIVNSTIAGMVAQQKGNWDLSRRAYAVAVVNSRIARLPVKQRAVLNYEYGRSLGVTCFFPEAEYELLLAHDLDKEAGAPLYFSLVELARLNLDQSKYDAAAEYFERALKELDSADFSSTSPIAYADILDEYALALKKTGDIVRSDELYASAIQIRKMNPEGESITDRTPYGTQCTAKKSK